ncbi:hypothetical protein SAMN05518872_101423 [Psychrobacillus sp. OK032]|nr:hypothetical protein SAMN05518872_101423 [Psychrobacillus sp. OK032]
MRILLFLISYGIAVISCSHLVLFLNFLSLGYSLSSVLVYMLQTKEFIMLCASFVALTIIVFFRGPLRLPS